MSRLRRVDPAVVAGVLLSIVLTLALLGPGRGRGNLLYRDFIGVPRPLWNPSVTGGDGLPPRAVPLDAVTVLMSRVVPSWLWQQVLVAATLFLAGSGMAVLLRRHGWVATCTGAMVMVWSPYAGERLLIGQPPILLSWSMLPWLVVAVRAGGGRVRWVSGVMLAALPAALTPFGGVLAAATALVATLLTSRRRTPGHLVALTTAVLVWCSPWLLALARNGRGLSGDPDAAAAFAVRPPEGNLLLGLASVVTGGGIWGRGAALASRHSGLSILASLVLVGLACWGLHLVEDHRMRRVAGIAMAGVPLLVLVCSGGPGLRALTAAQQVPAVALFRDTHRLLGVSWFVVAALTGLGAARLSRRVRPLRAGVVTTLLATAVLSAPDLPHRLHAVYQPVRFPVEWDGMVAAVGDRTTLVLPWQPLRTQPWVDGPFLDPIASAIRGTAVQSRTLTVQRGPTPLKADSSTDDPVAADLAGSDNLTAGSLRRAGISAVVEWRSTPGHLPAHHDGLTKVVDGPALRVWIVPDPA